MKNNKKEIKDDGSGRIVLLVLVLLASFLLVNKYILKPKNIEKYFDQYEIVNGRFASLEIDGLHKKKLSTYTYSINSTGFTKKLYLNLPCKNSDKKNEETRNELLEFIFPIAVSSENKEINIPLLRPQDWEKIGLSFPDSMSYMFNKYFDCTLWETLNADD